MKVGIIGAGSWGSALGTVLVNNNVDMCIWSWNDDQVTEINDKGTNQRYLPEFSLPRGFKASSDMKYVLENADIILMAVPSQSLDEVLGNAKQYISESAIIVNAAKGIELDTLRLMSEVVYAHCPNNKFVSLSGPSHAEEVARKQPTLIVVASRDINAAQIVQDVFSTDYFRVYTNSDVKGVELGGSLKNIIALGAGISDGIGYGDNAKAALMTRGLHEIARLGEKMGADSATFAGLTGIGDLVVTCTSMHSRNRRCGIYIGEGMAVSEAIKKVGMVVEGVYTVKSAYELSKKYDVEMPVTKYLYDVLYQDLNPIDAVNILMGRSKKPEIR